jgi:hypothetical protein
MDQGFWRFGAIAAGGAFFVLAGLLNPLGEAQSTDTRAEFEVASIKTADL